ncbi:hypothetical protein RQP46_001063 [Phenoliferia psychrophenolica]
MSSRGDDTHSILVAALSTLEVLSSMLSLDGELSLAPSTAAALPLLSSLADAPPSPSLAAQLPSELIFTILIALDAQTDAASTPDEPPSLRLTVSLPLSHPQSPPHLTLHQPTWLSRTAHHSFAAALAASLTSAEEDSTSFILDAIEWVRDKGSRLWEQTQEEKGERERLAASERDKASLGEGALVRVWFWLPSLSTREKRDNIVDWAPEYRLTGFVLAGKPALLCVEGTEGNIDSYMNDIKSVSWADIPSFQKKISERHRTTLDSPSSRAFTVMEEITHLVDKGGQRGNRGDQGQVRDWLVAKGLGEAFGIVIGGGSFVS